MTTDSATTTRVPRNHPELFLLTIWSALTQEPRYALTEYGELVLISMSFFKKFESSSVSGTCKSPDEQLQASLAASPSLSTISRGGSQPAQLLLRSSSVYSVLVYPDHLATPHGTNITFWHLPQSRDLRPFAEYRCNATREDIIRVVNSIRVQGVAPLFALVDRDRRLKLCNPSQILHRQKRSMQLENIYYVYRHKNCGI
jgi:hypothetical protein